MKKNMPFISGLSVFVLIFSILALNVFADNNHSSVRDTVYTFSADSSVTEETYEDVSDNVYGVTDDTYGVDDDVYGNDGPRQVLYERAPLWDVFDGRNYIVDYSDFDGIYAEIILSGQYLRSVDEERGTAAEDNRIIVKTAGLDVSITKEMAAYTLTTYLTIFKSNLAVDLENGQHYSMEKVISPVYQIGLGFDDWDDQTGDHHGSGTLRELPGNFIELTFQLDLSDVGNLDNLYVAKIANDGHVIVPFKTTIDKEKGTLTATVNEFSNYAVILFNDLNEAEAWDLNELDESENPEEPGEPTDENEGSTDELDESSDELYEPVDEPGEDVEELDESGDEQEDSANIDETGDLPNDDKDVDLPELPQQGDLNEDDNNDSSVDNSAKTDDIADLYPSLNPSKMNNQGEITLDMTGTQSLSDLSIGFYQKDVEKLLEQNDGAKIIVKRDKIATSIPAALLATDKFVYFNVKERNNNHESALSIVYDFSLIKKSGGKITTFRDRPITLTFTIDSYQVDNWDDVKVVYFNEQGKAQEMLTPKSFDKVSGEVVVDVTHFSSYGVFEVPGSGKPVGKSVTGDQKVENQVLSSNKELPNTATRTFNLMLAGLIMISISGVLLFIYGYRNGQKNT